MTDFTDKRRILRAMSVGALLVTSFLVMSAAAISAPNPLEDILWSKAPFEQRVQQAEAFFAARHPGVRLSDLTRGVHRDSDFVKFMRWQSTWGHSVKPDGTLLDPSAARIAASRAFTTDSLYGEVPWTNLSYADYIISQIGMGRTTSMAFHPTQSNVFYVGAAIGGIWRTIDGGQSYQPLGDGLPFMAVSSIIVRADRPSTIYIAVSDHVWYGPPGIGVYKSIDGGVSWIPTALTLDFGENHRIYWMEADPANPLKMFVATSKGLYRTTDGFQTVSMVSATDSFDVKINRANSNIVYLGGRSGEFLRSTDGGSTFTLIQDFGNSSVYVATTSLNSSLVYARHGTELRTSTDAGSSFPAPVHTLPETNSVVAVAPTDEDILLLGNFDMQRSDDGGATSRAISHWLGNGGLPLTHVDQRNIFTNPLEPDAVYYTNDGGVYRYSVSNDSFENLSDGLLITQFYDIAVAQSNNQVLSGGSQDNGNVFREANGVWEEFAPTGDGMNQEIDPMNANVRYWAYQNGGMRRWIDGTNTVISPPGQDGNGAWETPFRLDPSNRNRLVAGYSTVWASNDRGDSWTNIGGGFNFGGLLEEIAISASNPERIYASRGANLFIKSASGNSWSSAELPGPLSDLEVDPLNPDIIYITISGYAPGKSVFRSIDAGQTWSNITLTLPDVPVSAIEIYEDASGGLFVGTDVGVFYKDDTLATWLTYGNLPNTRVEDIEIQYEAQLIRVGTHGRGVLEAPIVIDPCPLGAPDADNDGVCDQYDACGTLDNSLIGTACSDGDILTSGEVWGIDCLCGGGTPNALYCSAQGATGTGGDWINRVAIGSLVNESGFSAYSDFKDLSATLNLGGSHELSMQLFQSFPLDRALAWVDMDRNGSFDGDELISMSGFDTNNRSTGTVQVPADAGLSPTVMRVRSVYSDTADSACGAIFGEVEDYTIRFDRCTAGGAFGTGSDWIKSVRLGDIQQDSLQSLYTDYTPVARTTLDRGQSYSMDVMLNYGFAPNKAFAWIDFDQDGIFEDDERTDFSSFAVGGNSLSTAIVTVPENAVPGPTVMRVRSEYANSGTPAACGFTQAGEVEDYEVVIGYCMAEGASGTGGDYINRVSFNGIENLSGKTRYSNFRDLRADVTRGVSYPIEVQMQYSFPEDEVDVWVDFDRDGEFEPSERTGLTMPEPGVFNAAATGTIVVPPGAAQGDTVMRIRAIFSDPDIVDACGSYFGEVEDYTVTLGYCAAEGRAGTGDDWISRVQLANLDHRSSQSKFSDFTDQVAVLDVGASYRLSTTLYRAFGIDAVYAWIDFNDDGSFLPDERIDMSDPAVGPNSVSAGTITVPPGTPTGQRTMRVRVLYANPNPADPCGSYFGEVEDYTVEFVEPVSADLAISITDDKTALAAGEDNQYTIVVSNAGPAGVSGATVNVSLPTEILSATWTCQASTGAACSVSGSGAINDSVDIPASASVVYRLTATTDPNFFQELRVDAEIVSPAASPDPNPGNNADSDVTWAGGVFVDGFEPVPSAR